MFELLIIKTGDQYIRCREDGYYPCSLEKASVFPKEKLEHVLGILADLKSRGYPDACLRKLTITEENYTT